MTSVLIVSSPADLHAVAVAWMLRRKGCKVSFLDTTSHASSERYSYLFETMDMDSLHLGEASMPDVVWRRRLYPRDPNPSVHPSDRRFVESELRQFERSILELIHHQGGARWVNPPAEAVLAENKLLQIRIAAKHGAIVPRTLVTRDPDMLRNFVAREGEAVAKPQVGHFWISGDTMVCQTKATVIDASCVQHDAPISVCPMIYQQKIDKVADLRVVKMGDRYAGIRMEMPDNSDALIDHRLQIFHPAMRATAFDVPDTLRKTMDSICAEFGIVYASCDFAEAANGDVVFLDLNPAGQFMFLESFVPRIPVLDQFSNFLIGRSDDKRPLRLVDFEESDEFRYWDAHLSLGHGNAYRPSHVISEEVA